MTHAARPTPFAHVDAKRIAANSLVVVVHAAVLALMLLPQDGSLPVKAAQESVPVIFIEKEKEIIPIPPPPDPVVPIQKERVVSTPQRELAPTPAPYDGPVFDSGEIFAIPAEAGPPVDSFEVGTPQVETLAYDLHPAPRYPRDAIREGRTGTVLLRVLVDETGQATEVQIEKSSGHRDLDRVAREQVLARWRFHPAQRMGRNVPAYALVPVAFNLPK